MQFSVIIPTLNESTSLVHSLKELLTTIENPSQVEIILCDGGSDDDSLQRVKQFPLTILNSPKGRALQMNAGAQQAKGDWLVFLHADTRLPENWMELIQHCKGEWGRFDVRLSGHHWLFRIIEKAMNLRSRKTSIATGDQVLFFKPAFFQKLGGFPEIPLMEDIAISKLARTFCLASCIPQQVITSSRRWEKNGILRTVALMWFLRLAYWVGTKPDKLHRLYYSS
ncbi:MAG: glycosyltransferase family 2 protein [Gammaproteobacteria bacterium]|jgi:rSAM/selenodomain-associated transferase 2|nr:glycosyltransferase family 2 protein [Gammaproteobacteria bacterium]